MQPRPRCLNIYAGPGVGKSSVMASIYAELKQCALNVEMAPEYAKELVLLGLECDQEEIFEVQSRRISVARKVDFVVTDSPLLQQLIYADNPGLRQRILAEYQLYDNLDILLLRSPTIAYDARGRYADLATALTVAREVHDMLLAAGIVHAVQLYEGRATTACFLDNLTGMGWVDAAQLAQRGPRGQ